MTKKFTYLIFILCSLFFLIILFIIKESEFTSTAVKDITVTSCSFFTLILAILLYDRFDYRKTIFQRKLEIVLDLLVNLKSSDFHIKYYCDGKSTSVVAFEIKRDSLKRKVQEKYLHGLFCFDNNYEVFFRKKILPFINNPFMPKEISESLYFFRLKSYHSINHLPDFQYKYIRMYYEGDIKFTDENVQLFTESSQTLTFKSYLDSYANCLDIIENWINKHSNIKSDLNI